MFLSIVIPVFKEREKIGSDIRSASIFFNENQLTGEIIVVDDGSGDETADVAESIAKNYQMPIQIIRQYPHKGKGFALRRGVAASRGEYVMFADSGRCVPYKFVLTGLRVIQDQGVEIAHGSRKLQESVIHRQQPLLRRAIGKIMRWLLIALLKVPSTLTDTQCGFKVYRGDVARQLFSQCVADGFLFDIEIILRAIRQDYQIREFPIEWTADPDSRLSPFKNFWNTFHELVMLRKIFKQLNSSSPGQNEELGEEFA